MILSVDYEKITEVFARAQADGRHALFEYETYELLKNLGSESIPVTNFLAKGARPSNEELNSLPGDRAVLKIVSPTIIHKTEVGGVKIIHKQPGKVRSSWRKMMDEVPENYARWIEGHRTAAPTAYGNLYGEELVKAISNDVRGVLMCEFMPPDSSAFGNELLVSIRRTREFGMVLTAGLGGTDTELYAQRFSKGEAVVSASAEMIDGQGFLDLFKKTIAYEKLAGKTRGQSRIVSDDQLLECFSAFLAVARHYSPLNPETEFVIEELEINPFAFTDYQMVPLDGMCRFSKPTALPVPRPVEKIDHLLHPKTMAIIGVSSKRMNFGRIILNNILKSGFDPSHVTIVRPGCDVIDGVACVDSPAALPEKADLFVVAINADQVPDLIDTIMVSDCAHSVMLIPGGLGEKKGSEDRARAIKEKIDQAHMKGDGGPVFVGGNCMGVISHPGSYDTVFVPEEKLAKQDGVPPKRAAFISQSGAFIISRTSKLPVFHPAYVLSIGNQNDLTAGDFVSHIKGLDNVDVIAVYMEGFKDLDGLAMCRAIRGAVKQGKEVVFYKAGRTPEGKTATSGHTASVAGDYMVCESCIRQAGAMVADSFAQFEDLFTLAVNLHEKPIGGNRLAAVSAAGFEAVGMADNIQGQGCGMDLVPFTQGTKEKLEALIRDHRLDSLVDVKNPMDINPSSNDAFHGEALKIIGEDPNIDSIIMSLDPLSPSVHTLPGGMREGEDVESKEGIATLIPKVAAQMDKPVLGIVDSGRHYDLLEKQVSDKGIPVFRSSDRVVGALAMYTQARLEAEKIRNMG